MSGRRSRRGDGRIGRSCEYLHNQNGCEGRGAGRYCRYFVTLAPTVVMRISDTLRQNY